MKLIALIFLFNFSYLTPTLADVQADAEEVYQEFLSPFCPGRSLADCPSTSAQELKKEIHLELTSGKSKETVMQELIQKFGSHLSSKPGSGSMAWYIPVGFSLLFLIGVLIWVRRNFQ